MTFKYLQKLLQTLWNKAFCTWSTNKLLVLGENNSLVHPIILIPYPISIIMLTLLPYYITITSSLFWSLSFFLDTLGRFVYT